MTCPAEALYFDNAPVAHVVQFREWERLSRIAETNRRAILRPRYGTR